MKPDEKSFREIDEAEVKKYNEDAPTWTGTCSICGKHLIGTPAELRKHKHGE